MKRAIENGFDLNYLKICFFSVLELTFLFFNKFYLLTDGEPQLQIRAEQMWKANEEMNKSVDEKIVNIKL